MQEEENNTKKLIISCVSIGLLAINFLMTWVYGYMLLKHVNAHEGLWVLWVLKMVLDIPLLLLSKVLTATNK